MWARGLAQNWDASASMVGDARPLAYQAADGALGVEAGADVVAGLVLVGLGCLVVDFGVDFNHAHGGAAGAPGDGQGRGRVEVFSKHGHLVWLSGVTGVCGPPCVGMQGAVGPPPFPV